MTRCSTVARLTALGGFAAATGLVLMIGAAPGARAQAAQAQTAQAPAARAQDPLRPGPWLAGQARLPLHCSPTTTSGSATAPGTGRRTTTR